MEEKRGVTSLLFLFGGVRDDIDEHPIGELAGEVSHLARLKLHRAGDQSEERVVLTAFDVLSGVVFSAALADDDVAHFHRLTAVPFHAETLGKRITA